MYEIDGPDLGDLRRARERLERFGMAAMRSLLLLASLVAAPAFPPLHLGRARSGARPLPRPKPGGRARHHPCARLLSCGADAGRYRDRGGLPGAQQARLKALPVPPATLVAGETAWRSYRDKWCAFESTAERDPGSRDATGLECRVEVSQAHLVRLKGAN